MGWWWLLCTAWAGEAELAVERGLVALELQDTPRARSQALRALAAEPTLGVAQDVYTDATAASGFGTLGATELVLYDREDPDWVANLRLLDEALKSGEYKPVRDATAALLVGWPEHPELLLPLWTTEVVPTKVVRLRERVLRALLDPKALIVAEPENLYRMRRLLMDAEIAAGRETIELRLVELGEERAPPRSRLTRVERTELAHQLSKEKVPALPWGYPSELVDVVQRLSSTWIKAGRARHAALAWSQLQRVVDDAWAWSGEAEAHLADGEIEPALRSANEAVLRATRPRATDLGALAAERQRIDLAQAHLVRARVHEANGDTRMALADLGLANVMAEQVLDDKLGERLNDVAVPLFDQLAARYRRGRSTPHEVALAVARGAKERDKAIEHLDDALFLMTLGTSGATAIGDGPVFYAGQYADILYARAQLEQQNGRVDQGRAAAVAATAVAGPSQPWWWKTRGELQEANGETDAAFASWSVARGLGVPDLEDVLERSYVGPASWEVAANHIGGPPPSEPLAPPKDPVATVLQPRSGSGGARSKRPPGAPRLGETFPGFTVDTGFGNLSSSSLKGRALIITFWNSSCGECLQMLPSFGSLARRLKKEGHDTVMIAVSTDEDDSEFEKVYRIGQRWGELVRDPALARKLGVDRLPTTWVVDTNGVARYFVDHWFSAEELEAQVRQAFQ